MEKRYSKQQIQETIKYWQNILKRMDESKNQLLDVCIKSFNEDIALLKEDALLDDVVPYDQMMLFHMYFQNLLEINIKMMIQYILVTMDIFHFHLAFQCQNKDI